MAFPMSSLGSLGVLAKPVVAVHPDFCSDHPVTLTLRELWHGIKAEIQVFEAHTNAKDTLCLRLKDSTIPLSSRRILVDAQDNPVADYNYKFYAMLTKTVTAKRGGYNAKFKIKGSMQAVEGAFADLVTGETVSFELRGNFPKEGATIWIDPGLTGQQVSVATLFRHAVSKERFDRECMDVLGVEIAGNMDKALIVLICVSVVEIVRNYRGNQMLLPLVELMAGPITKSPRFQRQQTTK